MPEINLVEIHFQDFVLGIQPFDLKGKPDLLELAEICLFARCKKDLRELLGQGTAALFDLAGEKVNEGRADYSVEIEPVMVIKFPVFLEDDGLDQVVRQVIEGYQEPFLDEILGNQPVLVVVDPGGDFRLVFFQKGDSRQMVKGEQEIGENDPEQEGKNEQTADNGRFGPGKRTGCVRHVFNILKTAGKYKI